ncbi:hypothetical protein [Capnocytophaga sp.]|uniref:hypothetical protein n=1 Tax=Capnocytophaga sp. TaxID=44737 RepID=UPI0026DB41D4|nr:hypothetical protein [Capnocytophaga sp.]MDO5104561.1 hypothetical protein [Capnocytophaga sp.]
MKFLKTGIKIFSVFLIFLVACSKSNVQRNPFLSEARFSFTINTDLPAYNALKYPQNTVFLPNIGIKGVFVTGLGNNRFVAWEAACPNQNPSGCEGLRCASKTTDGFVACDSQTKSYIFVICPCDKTIYSLVNGNIISTEQSRAQHPLLNYSVSVAGANITVSN